MVKGIRMFSWHIPPPLTLANGERYMHVGKAISNNSRVSSPIKSITLLPNGVVEVAFTNTPIKMYFSGGFGESLEDA